MIPAAQKAFNNRCDLSPWPYRVMAKGGDAPPFVQESKRQRTVRSDEKRSRRVLRPLQSANRTYDWTAEAQRDSTQKTGKSPGYPASRTMASFVWNRLAKDCSSIAMPNDNVKGMAWVCGKSVSSSGIAQLRAILGYESGAGGLRSIEVHSRNSTRICPVCGSLTEPNGRAGLRVRHWECIECGTQHDSEVNAAINTFTAAVGITVEGEVRCAA